VALSSTPSISHGMANEVGGAGAGTGTNCITSTDRSLC